MTVAKDEDGVYQTGIGNCWVLVYNEGVVLVAQHNVNQQTSSIYPTEEFSSEEEMYARIIALGMEIPVEEEEEEEE